MPRCPTRPGLVTSSSRQGPRLGVWYSRPNTMVSSSSSSTRKSVSRSPWRLGANRQLSVCLPSATATLGMGTHMHIELEPVQWVPAAVPNAPDDMHGQSWPLVPCYPAAVAVTGHSTIGLAPQRSQHTFWNKARIGSWPRKARSACSAQDQPWAKKREVPTQHGVVGRPGSSSRKCHLLCRVHASSTRTL